MTFAIAFLVIALVIFIIVLIREVSYCYTKNRFKVNKNNHQYIENLTLHLKRYQWLRAVITYIAEKLSMFNAFSMKKNCELAVVVLVLGLACITFILAFIIFTSQLVWYVVVAYAALCVLFMVFGLYVFITFAKIRFTGKLPETFKMINARYISRGNILKAIQFSFEDFDKSVKKEMYKIYNVLNKNDMNEVKNTFNAIEKIYRNEYLVVLLNLIIQAHYKGGNEVIKGQFEEATEDILISIENQKDLEATSRAYIILVLLLPLGIWGLEKFNISALGEQAITFYTTPFGLGLKILLYVLAIVYICLLLMLERVG